MPMPKRNVTSTNANVLVFLLASTGIRMHTMRTVRNVRKAMMWHAKLRQMGVSPNDLKVSLCITTLSGGHGPGTRHRPIRTCITASSTLGMARCSQAGYQNLGVYSYTSYLQGPLNNANIYAKDTLGGAIRSADGIQRRLALTIVAGNTPVPAISTVSVVPWT